MKIKKILLEITALSAMSAIVCGNTFAAISYTASDAIHLRDALVGKSTLTKSDDINGDGTIDIFDLCELRKSLSSTGEITTQSIPATENFVKLMGRTCRKDDITWLVQSGSAAEFTVSGTTAEITLAGDGCVYSDENYRPRYAVFVDDELVVDSTLSTPEATVKLFEGSVSKTAVVKVIHLSEAMNGAIGVKGISVTSESALPVKPVAKKDLCIEFIGDSITCAYGVEGLSNYESFKTTTENFMKSYAYLTAKKLNADYSAVSYSGHGIISGYTSSGDKNSDSLIPDCYSKVGKLSDYDIEWDFSSQKNDVVVINLGTNDSGYVTADIETRSQEFIDGYVEFLKTVRKNNPEAYIICTLGTMGCDEVCELVAEAVEEYSSTTSDKKIMSYKSVTQNPADGYGSDWHPSAVTQQNSAYVLADKICQALGIESDQVGLDVAADASYDVVIDPEMGGNAASYLGYDKSFWINMVNGGNSPEAIEAVISGIGLKKGGEYRLEFDYTSNVDIEVPVIIRSDSKVFHTDSVKAVSEKNHYSETFISSESDENAAIVLQLGGQDYYNFTLSNVKLVKIS